LSTRDAVDNGPKYHTGEAEGVGMGKGKAHTGDIAQPKGYCHTQKMTKCHVWV